MEWVYARVIYADRSVSVAWMTFKSHSMLSEMTSVSSSAQGFLCYDQLRWQIYKFCSKLRQHASRVQKRPGQETHCTEWGSWLTIKICHSPSSVIKPNLVTVGQMIWTHILVPTTFDPSVPVTRISGCGDLVEGCPHLTYLGRLA